MEANEFRAYDYAAGRYIAGGGLAKTQKDYTLFSPKLGISYALTPKINVYASIASAEQAPATSELFDNNNLKKSKALNKEIGLKGSVGKFVFDTALYQTSVKDEVVTTISGTERQTQNAGETDKKGFEASLEYEIDEALKIGGSYAYSDYKYENYTELARVGYQTVNADRSGNRLKYVPMHQYSLFASYKKGDFKAKIKSDSWGKYYIDDANTQEYEGYKFVTSAMIGWEKEAHSLVLTVDNLFDKKYAMEVKKDSTSSAVSYTGAARRSALLTYSYKF